MGLAGRLWGAEMCRDTSECIQTVVEGLGKAMACGYTWVHVGGVLVRCVRAAGAEAHGEGLSACIGSLGGARCGRSAMWGHMEVSHCK